MAVDAAHLAPRIPRTRALPAVPALAAMVAIATIGRFALGVARETPRYFPDEHLYSQIARSIADGRLDVLGAPSGLPALLQPLLTAPFWLPGDPELAFRLTQLFQASVMAAAAIPVYLLARRLSQSTNMALAVAAVAVWSPDLVYAGYVTADAVGYALALTAVWLAVRALARGGLAAHGWFLVAASLATFARLQYVVLLAAAAIAALAVERWRPADAFKRHWPVFVAAGGLLAAALASGTVLGRYTLSTSLTPPVSGLVWAPLSAWLLFLAAGVMVAPGATVWLVVRPFGGRGRDSTAAATVIGCLLLALLVAATLISTGTGSNRFFERYLMAGIPLLAVSFAAWASDGRPGRRVAAGLGVVIAAGAAWLPLSTYTAGQGRSDSPFLQAVAALEQSLDVGTASLVVALLVTVGAFVAVVTSLATTAHPFAVVCATAGVLAVATAGAHTTDIRLSHDLRDRHLPTEMSWVDAARVGPTTLVQTAGSDPARAMSVAFWNASVTKAALLGPDAEIFDGAMGMITVERDGLLRLDGAPLTGPLLVARDGSRPLFTNATVVDHGPGFDLVHPRGEATLAAIVTGLGEDEWLAARSVAAVYPRPGGCRSLALTLSLPDGQAPQRVTVSGQGPVTVRAGDPVTIVVTSTDVTPGRVELTSATPRFLPDQGIRPLLTRSTAALGNVDCP